MSSEISGARSRTVQVLRLVSVVAVWVALLGPAWAYVPATTSTPPTSVTFADLVAVNSTNPNALQAAFYGWIAWVFAVLTTTLVIAAIRFTSRIWAIVTVVCGAVQLLITMLVSAQAAPSLSALLSSLPYTRSGTVLFLGSMICLICAGILSLRPPVAQNASATVGMPVPATS
ncbi:MAG: hypothetical protein V7706_19000 [Dietzia psychralcaliphila]